MAFVHVRAPQHAPVVPAVLLQLSFASEQHRVLGLAPPGSEVVHVRPVQHPESAVHAPPPVAQVEHSLAVPLTLDPPALQTPVQHGGAVAAVQVAP